MDKLFNVAIRDYIPGEPPLTTLHVSMGVASQMQDTHAHGRIEVEHGEAERDDLAQEIANRLNQLITDDGEPFEDGMQIIARTLRQMQHAPGGMDSEERMVTRMLAESLHGLTNGEFNS